MNNTHLLKTVVIMTTFVVGTLLIYAILRGFEVQKINSLIAIGVIMVLATLVVILAWQSMASAEDAAENAKEEEAERTLEATEATGEKAELLAKAAKDAHQIAENLAKEAMAAEKAQPIVAAIAAGVGSVGLPLAIVVEEAATLDDVVGVITAIVACVIALGGAFAATKVGSFWKNFSFNLLCMSAMGIGCYFIFKENLFGFIIVGMSTLLTFAIAYWDAITPRNNNEAPVTVQTESQSVVLNGVKKIEILDPVAGCGTKNQS